MNDDLKALRDLIFTYMQTTDGWSDAQVIAESIWDEGYRRHPVGTEGTKRTQVTPSGDGQPVGITEDMVTAAEDAVARFIPMVPQGDVMGYEFPPRVIARAALEAAEALRHG